MREEKKWYVIYTKSKSERRTVELFEKKQIPVYFPEYSKFQYLYGRSRVIKVPLIPSLFFAFLSEKQLETITNINGVAGVLYKLQRPAIIKSKDIDAMQRFLATYDDVVIEKVPLDIHNTHNPLHLLNSSDKLYADVPYEAVTVYLPSLGYSLTAKSVKALATNIA